MQAKAEIITPGYAKQLLEQANPNRPLSNATVRRYAADNRIANISPRWEPKRAAPESDAAHPA